MTMRFRLFPALVLAGSLLLALLQLSLPALAAEKLEVYKSPYCGCCEAWVDHMRAAGFAVEVNDVEDLTPVKERYGITPDLASCHTAVLGDYVIEGHVPAEDVARLLEAAPQAQGLAVPGMPLGSPGMEQGDRSQPYDVIVFTKGGKQAVFARH
ncbi:MAG: DUF411 domain-containing protein [Pseudomonadota bacterium]|uniref:DUF411 domain-containing protein n=1 Tax=Fodinicurvata fenggangensis TaxID=1121830 RepID=UPI0009DE6061|nr:DUF411 domain-containing protein [Fodinicurvata fenggangensis]